MGCGEEVATRKDRRKKEEIDMSNKAKKEKHKQQINTYRLDEQELENL
jgi:hypothetical protein